MGGGGQVHRANFNQIGDKCWSWSYKRGTTVFATSLSQFLLICTRCVVFISVTLCLTEELGLSITLIDFSHIRILYFLVFSFCTILKVYMMHNQIVLYSNVLQFGRSICKICSGHDIVEILVIIKLPFNTYKSINQSINVYVNDFCIYSQTFPCGHLY